MVLRNVFENCIYKRRKRMQPVQRQKSSHKKVIYIFPFPLKMYVITFVITQS